MNKIKEIPVAIHMSEKTYRLLKDSCDSKGYRMYKNIPIVIDNSIPFGTFLKQYEGEDW